jgi:hypothetical protein
MRQWLRVGSGRLVGRRKRDAGWRDGCKGECTGWMDLLLTQAVNIIMGFDAIDAIRLADSRAGPGRRCAPIYGNLSCGTHFLPSTIDHGYPRNRSRMYHTTADLIATDLIAQAGVVTGDNVRKIFDYAKQNNVSICSVLVLAC